MSSIDLSGVSYAHSDSVPLLQDVSLRLRPGWTAVVGANGSGKTTLLRLLAGELEPDAGRIARRPDPLPTQLCHQEVEALGTEVHAFAASTAGHARELRGRLALDAAELARWPTLSPGERKRWQVGTALAADPPLLLLDEPTNHLDAAARALLVGALRRYTGIGLVVSHDRTLLNDLSDHTLRLHRAQVRAYRGPYDTARVTWEMEEREQQSAHAQIRREQRKLERRLGDRRRSRDRAEAGKSTRRRMKGQHDSDARARFKQKRRRSAEVSLGREIGILHGKLERLDQRERDLRFQKARGRALFVDYERASVRRLLELHTPELRAGAVPLLRGVRVEIMRHSRIHLTGPNGSGKTTLLNALLDRARLPRSRWLYLPQEIGTRHARSLVDEARALDPEGRGRLMGFVAALGVDPGALLASARPSPGEARKLELAMGMARQVWVAVLDEPTNHLDLPSIERLEDALADYPGALLLVSHDDAFATRLTDTVWALRGGCIDSHVRA